MKKKKSVLWTSVLLAAVLLLPSCGEDSRSEENDGGTVYVPEYLDVELPVSLSYIDSGCSDGENLYVIAEIETIRQETDEETGETYETYDYSSSILRIPLTGGAAVELENYKVPASDSTEETYRSTGSISADKDGNLWIREYSSTPTFELPTDFDETTDSKWNYQTGNTEETILRQVDSTGAELSEVELTGLEEVLGTSYLSTAVLDEAGNIYITGENKLFVLDSGLNQLMTLEAEESEDLFSSTLVLLGDGRIGVKVSYNKKDPDTGEETWGGYRLKSVDLTQKAWGTTYDLPSQAYTILPGGGNYLFYYENGDSVYGFDAATGEEKNLFSWIASDINKSDVSLYTFLSDGRVVVLLRTYDYTDGRYNYSMAILTATDASTLPEKTTLTFATLGVDYQVRNQILAFNRSSDKYRIVVTDYSEYNTGDSSSAGLTKLTTEIGAGHVPDIIQIDTSIPLRQYAAKGVLEDLWPYIENDPDLGREGVMEHVLQTSEIDGKLPQIFSTFNIRTVAGSTELVGDRMSWTLQDLRDALAQMPEGCVIFGESDTKSGILSNVLAQNLDSFVDWTTGKCSFDSDQFKALLEFCNSFPAEYNWETYVYESDGQRVQSGKQMLLQAYIYSIDRIQYYDAVFDGQASFIGYPQEDGSVGSTFVPDTGLAMSTTCADKDGAWSFMRQILLPTENGESDDNYSWWYGIPVNRTDFDRGVEDAMTVTYEVDENGDQILDEDGQPIPIRKFSSYISDEKYLETTCVTQEEVDRFMALYNATNKVYNYDESIFDIIQEQVQAYFVGDRDVDSTAAMIQSRVELYVNEQR